MTDIELTLVALSNIASLLLGWLSGRLLQKNEHTGKLEMDVRKLNGGVALGVVVAILALVSLGLTTYNNERQQDCNQQVVDTIIYRSKIGDEDQRLNTEARKNIIDLIIGVSVLINDTQSPAAERQAKNRELFREFVAEQALLDAKLEENSRARAENPVPPLDCDNI